MYSFAPALTEPPGTWRFCVCRARATLATVKRCDRSFRASNCTLICRACPPTISTWPTPGNDSNCRRSTLSQYSVRSRIEVGAETAMVITGDRIGIELLDERLVDVPGQVGQNAVDLVADFLGRHVGVLLQDERDEDLRDAFRGHRAEFVDAAGRVDGLLDLVGDFRLHFLRRQTGQPRGHGDDGEVDLGEAVQAEVEIAHHAEHEEDQREHRGENRPANANRSEKVHTCVAVMDQVGQ